MKQFELPALPYNYDALEPWIDEKTMMIHHTKHHKGYVTKLNNALKKHPELPDYSLEQLLASLDELPKDIATDVKNNGGGHYNHSLFWTVLTPRSANGPQGEFRSALGAVFGNYDTFKKSFSEMAAKYFGSGWAWLSMDREKKIAMQCTHDHDCPITRGLEPLFVIDLWEHAYYLKYQNERAEYISNLWNIINWSEVENRFFERSSLSREIAA